MKFKQEIFIEIFNNSQNGILIVDQKGTILNFNKPFERIFEFKESEIVGLNVGDVIFGSERNEFLDIRNKVIQGKAIMSNTLCLERNGLSTEVRLLAFPVKLEMGEMRICLVFNALAYTNSSLKDLELQKVYFRQLFENSPEAICILDTEDRFVDVNHAFEQVFGYTKEELINSSINDAIVSARLKAEATELSENVIKGNIVDYETLRSRKDGSYVNVHILGYPLIFEDKKIGVFGIYKDITEQKRAEEALKESEHTFRTLFEGSSDAILILDDNKFVDCNPATMELLGYDSKENIIDRYIWELSPEFQAKGLSSKENALEIIRTTDRNKKFEWLLEKKDGTIVPVEAMLTSILLTKKSISRTLAGYQ